MGSFEQHGRDAGGGRVRFGILQRYVSGEVFRSFFMALLTITIVFVLFMVMAQATSLGLTPPEILRLVPCVIPASLPYTVPVSLLFAVTVVYGRLAGDNEVIAVKAAGMSAWAVLWPAMSLGLVISLLLLFLSADAIPRANVAAKLAIFKNFEDGFYKYLKKDREINSPGMPFLIRVKDVVDRELIGATFKHRVAKATAKPTSVPNDPGGSPGARIDAEDPSFFDTVIMADKARIQFDTVNNVARVYLDGANIQQGSKQSNFLVNEQWFELPLPPEMQKVAPKRIQEMTLGELESGRREMLEKIAFERKRQAYAAALWIASGRPGRADWVGLQSSFLDYTWWQQKANEYETEKQMRTAMAWGSLFFVILGAPIGIRFARRDFLSAFITCFVPIIVVYYPLMLGGTNLGKEGIVPPILALWVGNGVLLVLAALTIRPVLKH